MSFKDSADHLREIPNTVGGVGKNRSDILLRNAFKLQLRLAEVAKYQQIVKLLLFYSNRITALKPTDFAVAFPSESRSRASSEGLAKQRTINRLLSENQLIEPAAFDRSSTLHHGSSFGITTKAVLIIEEEKSEEVKSVIMSEQNESESQEVITIDGLIAQHTQASNQQSEFLRMQTEVKDHRSRRDIWYSQTKFSI